MPNDVLLPLCDLAFWWFAVWCAHQWLRTWAQRHWEWKVKESEERRRILPCDICGNPTHVDKILCHGCWIDDQQFEAQEQEEWDE